MEKTILYLFIVIGGFIGGYLPILVGFSGFSVASIIGSTIGSIIGIIYARRITE